MLYLKMSYFIVAVFAGLCMIKEAGAWPLIADKSIHSAWGVENSDWGYYPTGVNYAQFCVGDSQNGSGCQKRMGIHGDDEAMVGLVAWQVTANGGYFCVTQFQCEGKSKPYTWNLAPNGTQKCFWLCKNGYSGEGCMPIDESEYVLATGDAGCSAETISREDFKSNTVKTTGNTGLNQENSIQLFYNGRSGKKEMDVMLGVSGWLSNKKGVIASPFLFWCSNKANSNTFDINFFTQYKSEKLCLPGYTGANCERCKVASMCNGYTFTDYDNSKHTLSMKGGCTVFRCAEGMGFASATKRTECVECKGQSGVNEDGVCVKCPTGEIWDTKAKACRQALILSQPGMRYGAGKTTAPENISDACWVKEDPIQYECCVRNKKWNADTSKCE